MDRCLPGRRISSWGVSLSTCLVSLGAQISSIARRPTETEGHEQPDSVPSPTFRLRPKARRFLPPWTQHAASRGRAVGNRKQLSRRIAANPENYVLLALSSAGRNRPTRASCRTKEPSSVRPNRSVDVWFGITGSWAKVGVQAADVSGPAIAGAKSPCHQ